MVNLRYHVVSLVAVFLALGIGIVMGATVIDRVTVDTLNNRVHDVERTVNGVRAENGRLGDQIKLWNSFTDQTRDRLLAGRLHNVPVLLLGVRGIDGKGIDGLRRELVTAGANVEGTLWLTDRLRLNDTADSDALAAALGVPVDRADLLRRAVVARLAGALDGTAASASLLKALRDGGFVDFEPPTQVASTPGASPTLPVPGSRFVVVSGAGAVVADAEVAIPLAETLARADVGVVAAESGQDTPGGRGVFVGLLRKDPAVAVRMSTVDNLESFIGQAASVLAVEDLAVPRVGHYGVGPGAQQLVPGSPSR